MQRDVGASKGPEAAEEEVFRGPWQAWEGRGRGGEVATQAGWQGFLDLARASVLDLEDRQPEE